MSKIRTLILGAAGRDFHNFNVVYRENPDYEVVAFTATQIPDIDDRKYPAQLAGDLYPQGIPILPEDELENIIREKEIELCVMSYSDLSDNSVMELCARVNAAGADFTLLGAERTMLKSTKPVISVCAVRTGCGKSQTTRRVIEILQAAGRKVVAIRHPMPYGDLVAQKVQRFEKIEDLKKHNCTIEEMEEYEPHIRRGNVIYAGVDYEAILREAEKEADIILWDGGNNDTSFYVPDILITVVDPHRPGHEISYYPGQTNLRMADVVVINKIDSAYPEDVDIEVTGNTLTIKGETTNEEQTEEDDYLCRECHYGSYYRTVTLPQALESDKAEATFGDGVLTLTMPKTEVEQPKQIEVKAKKAVEGGVRKPKATRAKAARKSPKKKPAKSE